jgi:hypothetical protein
MVVPTGKPLRRLRDPRHHSRRLVQLPKDGMAIQSPSQISSSAGYRSYEDEERGSGWVLFAAVVLLYLGVLNIIEGVAAVSNAHSSIADHHHIVGNLNAWGWLVLATGMSQVLLGMGVFARNQLSRWGGVIILGLNAIAQLLMIRADPFLALAVVALDILAIYGLIAYGRRIASAT